jgi:hypothetical protein
MLLDATLTFLNFGLAKAEGFQRGFQSKEQGLVPIFLQWWHVHQDSFRRRTLVAAPAARPCLIPSPKLRNYHGLAASNQNASADAG